MKKILVLFSILALSVFFIGATEVVAKDAPQDRIVAKKVEIDTDADGKIDRVEIYNKKGEIETVESDVSRDGKTDEWLYYEGGKLTKAAKDTSGDGKQDTWISY